jgi:hypothetical protein
VAATTRMSTGSDRESPTRVTARSWSARRSFTWREGGISPTSSRKRVPPLAAWNRPGREATAPVKAPRTWPKSSLSISPSGMAAQFTATNGPVPRGERRWISRATSSLPVPVSPWSSTVTSVAATFSMRR